MNNKPEQNTEDAVEESPSPCNQQKNIDDVIDTLPQDDRDLPEMNQNQRSNETLATLIPVGNDFHTRNREEDCKTTLEADFGVEKLTFENKVSRADDRNLATTSQPE